MKTRCFVDANGYIWTINHEGESNFPGDIKLDGNTVQILGINDCLGPGREISEEYQLWPSLTSLAIVLERDDKPSIDGSISLDQAVADAHSNIESFRQEWLDKNAKHPDRYPMSLPKDNAGLWFEQIHIHEQNLT